MKPEIRQFDIVNNCCILGNNLILYVLGLHLGMLLDWCIASRPLEMRHSLCSLAIAELFFINESSEPRATGDFEDTLNLNTFYAKIIFI